VSIQNKQKHEIFIAGNVEQQTSVEINYILWKWIPGGPERPNKYVGNGEENASEKRQ
jgi:hypothetical protein